MPSYTASMVAMICKEMGWAEHFVLWELPMGRANQYEHALLVSFSCVCAELVFEPSLLTEFALLKAQQ